TGPAGSTRARCPAARPGVSPSGSTTIRTAGRTTATTVQTSPIPTRPTATRTAGPTTAPRRPSPRRWSWHPPTTAPGRKRGGLVIAARRAAGHPGAMKLVPKDGSLRRVVLVAYPDVQILDVTG